ncbi:protein of unknown function [Burkholderia multivorans]
MLIRQLKRLNAFPVPKTAKKTYFSDENRIPE